MPGGALLLHVLYESVPYNKQITPLVSCFYVQAKGNLVIDNDVSREKRIIYIVPCNTDSLPKMFHRLCFLLLKAKNLREKISFYSKSSQHKPKWSLILLSRVLEKKNPSSGTEEFCFFGGFSLSEFVVFDDDGCMPYKRFKCFHWCCGVAHFKVRYMKFL